jgi:hypothetical protein
MKPDSMAMPALLQSEIQAMADSVLYQDAPTLRAQFGPAVVGNVKRRAIERLFRQRFTVQPKPPLVFRGRDPMTFTTFAVM